MKFSVHFAQFPYGGSNHKDVTRWLIKTIHKAKTDSRISDVFYEEYDDTPIYMTRNLAVQDAKRNKADYLVMVDNDMRPDSEPGAVPFWDSSLEFLLERRSTPAIIAAPYCGKPPHCNVFIFKWENFHNLTPEGDTMFRLEQFGRNEAAYRTGIERVAALPTGLMIIDMRVFDKLKHPYFDYEWTDGTKSKKASTEDVYFSRDVELFQAGEVYCNWDTWAGHHKYMCVGKPQPIFADQVGKRLREAVEEGMNSDERIMMVDPKYIQEKLKDIHEVKEEELRGVLRGLTATSCVAK